MWKASRNIFILTLVISLASAEEEESLSSIEQALNEQYAADVNPLVQTIVEIGDYLCPIVIKILEPDSDPDMSPLTIQYRTREGTTVRLNMENAAKEISERFSQYNPDNILMVFVHGFGGGLFDGIFIDFYTALEATGQYNILGVDTTSVIGVRDSMGTAVTAAKYIGEELGKSLVRFNKLLGQPWEKIHLVGFSLGAHICGVAGSTVVKLGYLIARITGVDTGGPCYVNVPHKMKLGKTDAEFVHAIHTNSGVFGLSEIVGHFDSFPNGGSYQPGSPIPGVSHARAPQYYIESIYNENAFLAVPCPSYEDFQKCKCSGESVVMGHYCRNTTRGVHFLRTAATSPFGLGEEGARCDAARAGAVQNILK